ncbi:MAG TPA: RNA methyltransferase [Clostridia bacterium]|nr:RNA methyltransferase [Clostridia bacterium]HHY06157.1 RNA methyltransferase [Clostridia bacterium]
MKLISSRQNPLLKERCKLQQKKFREKSGLFLIEGIRLVEEAVKAGCLEEVFVEEALFSSPRGQELFKHIENSSVLCFQVNKEMFKALSETESSQGIIGVVKQQKFSWTDLKIQNGLILILDSLQDPGNLGTIWRTAWAAGVDVLFCLPGTVDPYNGKTIRASMGSVFHLPVVVDVAWPSLYQWCQKEGFQLVAGDLQAKQSHFAINYADKVALLIGNEGRGFLTIPPENVEVKVKIPLSSGAESLNVAVACGILTYEILRQRSLFKTCNC